MKGAATKEQIKKWKAENPQGIHEVQAKDSEGETHVTYVKKPTLHEIGASAKYAESDPIKSGKIMFDTCRLGGSETVPNDEEMKMGIVTYLGTLFKVAEVTGKPL